MIKWLTIVNYSQIECRENKNKSETEDEEEFLNWINILKVGSKPSLMWIDTNNEEVFWQPDTGATRNIWDEKQ